MGVDSGGTERSGRADDASGEVGGSGWGPDLEDDSGAVMKAVGRQIKVWREAAGLKQAELGAVPAHAGMVPRGRHGRIWTRRVPRACGDGPGRHARAGVGGSLRLNRCTNRPLPY